MKSWALFAAVASVITASSAPAVASERVISFIGDSTTGALYSPPGYPALVGTMMHVRIHNLAVKYPPSYTTLQALLEELPTLPADTTDAVLFLGVDDLTMLGDKRIPLKEVEDANRAIVASLHKRRIRVYELTIRDYTQEAAWHPQPYDLKSRSKIRYYVDALNAFYRATPGVTIVDARAWSDVYAGKWTPDGIHMFPDSLRRFAAHVAQALKR